MKPNAPRTSIAPAAPTAIPLLVFLALVLGSRAPAALAQTEHVGLYTPRVERLGNVVVAGMFTPQTADLLGYALAAGDFNGDGTDDLAIGVPFDNAAVQNPIVDSGSVVVRYGWVGDGKLGPPVYLRHRDVTETGDQLGRALAACDLNGDGFEDLAVGIPFERYLDQSNAGIVQVHFGFDSGLPVVADTYFAQSTPGVQDDVESGDRFGWSLACADFDGDGYGDLAVGAPGEKGEWDPTNPLCPPGGAGCKANAGRVNIVPGSAAGLDYARSTIVDQDVDGVPNEQDDGDNFGHALAAADFDGDGYADLAVGTPGEDDFAGGVAVLFGGPGGLHAVGDALFLGENVLGGTREDGDSFGASLAAGDLDGDGFADLAIGVPDEDSDAADSGQVAVAYGFAAGLDLGRAELWSEDQVFGPGTSQQGDRFGYGLAIGDFDRDGHGDLAIGHPGERMAGIHDGAATVLVGSEDGLTAERRRTFAAGKLGMPGNPLQAGEQLGHALAAGDFDGDGHSDLALASPAEDEGGIADVGAVTVLYGALFADGVETGSTARWPQTTFVPNNNELAVTTAARLGPAASKRGIQLSLVNPSLRQPGFPAFVRVGPEAGFADETTLYGSFHLNPQALAMSTDAGANSLQIMALTDSVGTMSFTRLSFHLVRNTIDGDWFINAQHFNDEIGAVQFSGGGFFALDGTPAFADTRIEFLWIRGNPSRLTMWRTRFVNGVPEDRIQMFFAYLSGMQFAAIDHVFAGAVAGHRPGTFGTLYLDELTFRR